MRIRVMLAIILVVIFSVSVEAATPKPNIVLIFMDNFGYGELGVYGGGITRGAPTPRIDTLAKATAGHFWVRWPMAEILKAHVTSLKKEPAIKAGTPDPYVPPKKQE